MIRTVFAHVALWCLLWTSTRTTNALSALTDRRKSPALWRLLEYHDTHHPKNYQVDNGALSTPSSSSTDHHRRRRPIKPEIMAPAGGFAQLKAAVANGADAVYVGLSAFSARARAANFDAQQLKEAVDYCHKYQVHLYVAMNTLIFDREWTEVVEWIQVCRAARVDAMIIQDLGLCRVVQRLAPDIPIHSSTQQSITDADGVDFCASHHAATRVVLGRELSCDEIAHVHDRTNVEIEVFCHGALCVSYSGQCFSSEAWGGRSANRGQCAQACRLPYGLLVNGKLRDTQDMRYLLSPQDLSGLDQVPQLIQAGVSCLKIEGRLKDAEYVAATSRAYRQRVDQVWEQLHPDEERTMTTTRTLSEVDITRQDLVQLFARGQDETHDGLTSGFLDGVKHQNLVRGRSPRHRGVHVGRVQAGSSPSGMGLLVQLDEDSQVHLKLGDGLVVDRGQAQEEELGGTIYEYQELEDGLVQIQLGRDSVQSWQNHEQKGDILAPPGAHVWRTHDALVAKKFRKLATADPIAPKPGVRVQIKGQLGEPLEITISDGKKKRVRATSAQPLEAAQGKGLSIEQVRKAVGSLGNTNITLAGKVQVSGMEGLWCPVSQIKQARRQAIEEWQALYGQTAVEKEMSDTTSFARDSADTPVKSILNELLADGSKSDEGDKGSTAPRLSTLCRTYEQVDAVCEAVESEAVDVVSEIIIDFLELGGMREAMERIRKTPEIRAVVASPRILKPEEGGIWKSLLSLRPDALLVRSTGLLHRMQKLGGQGASVDVGTLQEDDWVTVPELLGDFSLNVANALTASELLNAGLSRVTASYDLNARSIEHMADLLQDSSNRLEVVVHCHMPIFHTEHCVFARFLTKGNSYLDCGHACTRNNIHLRDEMTGLDNLVLVDMGCRNTVFAAQSQSGVYSLKEWNRAGVRQFRIEFVDEDRENTKLVLDTYVKVLKGSIKPKEAWERLEYILDSNGRAAGVNLGSFRNTQERRAGEVQ